MTLGRFDLACRVLLPVSLIVLLSPLVASAQEAGTTQIFVGFSYLEMKPAKEEVEIEKEKLKGWHATVTYWLTDRFGLTGDVSGHSGAYPLPPNVATIAEMEFDHIMFLVGPRIKIVDRGRFSSSFRALFGGSTATTVPPLADVGDTLVLGSIFRQADETVFAMNFGVSFDVALNDTVAIRLFQPNFALTKYGEETQNSFRFSSGVIFNLGG